MLDDIPELKRRAAMIGLKLYQLADLAGVSRHSVWSADKHKTNIGIHRVVQLNKALAQREEELRRHLQERSGNAA